MNRLRRLLNIKPDEVAPVAILAAYYFALQAAQITGIATSNSIFFARLGEETAEQVFPYILTANPVLAFITVTTFTRLSKWLNLRVLVIGSILFSAGVHLVLLLSLNLSEWTSTALLAWASVSFTISLSQYYLVAASVFDTRQAKRIFGLIGIGGAVAGILGGLVLSPVARTLGSEAAIVMSAIFIALSAVAVYALGPYMKTESKAQTHQRDQPKNSGAFDWLDSYMVTIMVITVATILVATLVEVQFRFTVKDFFGDNEDAQTEFFGLFAAGVGFIQLVFRIGIVGRLLRRFGILVGLLALPIAMAFTSIAFFALPIITMAVLIKATDQSIRYTIHETSNELVWVPVPAEQRVAAKPFISATLIAVTQGVTGLIVAGMNFFFGVEALSALILLIVAIWIPAAIALRRGYVRKLMSSIRDRNFEFDELSVDSPDAAVVQTVERSLRSGNEVEQAFVLDIIDGTNLTPWAVSLRDLFHTGPQPIRERILSMVAFYPAIVSDEELRELIQTQTDLTDEAIIIAGLRGLNDVMPVLYDRLATGRPEAQAAAAGALLRFSNDSTARDKLNDMLIGFPEAQNYAIDTLMRLPSETVAGIISTERLRLVIDEGEVPQKLLAIPLAAHAHVPLIESLVNCLEDRRTEEVARYALNAYPPDEVRRALLIRYSKAPTPLKVGISRALDDYPHPETTQAMLSSLSLSNRQVYNEAVNTLLLTARQMPLPEEVLKELEGDTMQMAEAIYALHNALLVIENNGQTEVLLQEVLETDIHDDLPTLLKLAVMDVPETEIETIIERLQTDRTSPSLIANILELLDNLLSRQEREVIIPLFEDRPRNELDAIGKKHFSAPNDRVEDEIIGYINNGDPWQSAVALDYALRNPGLDIHLTRHAKRVSPLTRDLIAKPGAAGAAETVQRRTSIYEEGSDMYSVLEKTVFLKQSSLFEDINARDLFHIAQIMNETAFESDQRIFEEGELGDSMFVIARGRVRIHQGNHGITVLEPGDAMGEIAMLDHAPRTASATALEETILLRIDGDDFYRVLATRADVMQSILQLLTRRLRGMLDQEQHVGNLDA